MIKCPSCEHENVPGTQFCEGCGEELPQANAAPSTGATAPADDQLVKCPACDNMNPPDNVICEVCGADLIVSASSDDAAVPPPSAPSASGLTANAPAPDATAGATPATGNATAAITPGASAPAVGDATDVATAIATDGPLASDSTPPGTVVAAGPATTGAPTPLTPAPQANLLTSPTGGLEPGRVKLVVEQGQTVGAQFILGDAEMLVGREDEEESIYPDIDLSDQDAGYVHRRHATLRLANGQLTVEHLGGSNKTRINNKPIPDNEPQPVSLGDKIAFGKVVLRVRPA